MADRLEGFCDPSSISYLTQREAAEIDENLMGPLGFSVDQLMELAGLSVATSIAERSKVGKFSDKVGRQRNSHFSGSESDEYASSHRTKFRRKDMEPNRRGSKFDGRGSRGNRDNFSDDDFDGPLRGARGGIKSRGPRADEFSGRKNDRRSDGSRNYKSPGPRAEEFSGRRNDQRSDGSRNYKSLGPRADEFSGRRNDRRSDGSRNYNSPRPRADEFSGRRKDRRSDGSRNYKSLGAGKFENNQRGRFNTYKDDRGGNSDDFRNRRRVIGR